MTQDAAPASLPRPGTPADIDIVVVTYNSDDVVHELLDGIPAGLAGLTADVVVVDNGSQDATADHVTARGDCRVIRSTNKGYSAGLNIGASAASGAPAILILNADVRVRPGSLAVLFRALQQARRVAVVAPKVVNPDGSLYLSLRREPTIPRAMGLNFTGRPAFSEYVIDEADYEVEHDVDWALGAALMLSRPVFDRLGGWDESFFLYSEETDYCLRAREAGYVTRYVPDAVVEHIGGASGQSDATHIMQIVNRVRLYRRRHKPVASSVYWALAVVSETTWIMRGHSNSKASVRALLRPKERPAVMHASDRLIPI